MSGLSRRELLLRLVGRGAAPAARGAAMVARDAEATGVARASAASSCAGTHASGEAEVASSHIPRASSVNDPPPRVAGTFSIDDFYARRPATAAADAVFPVFAVRARAALPTTRVGDDRRPDAAPPRWMPERCLAATSFCSACVEHCPQPGALTLAGGRVWVSAARCDGCGRCVEVCPAPTPALVASSRAGEGGRA
ncbi:MAG: 4Fe-4S binding protein [Kofleriaceae bacterium]